MAKIRVLQVVTRLVVRGAVRHVVEIAAGLDPDRFEVEIAAGRGEPGEGSLWEEAAARGIRTLRIKGLRRAVTPAADLVALAALYRAMRRGGYDIVHTHISKAGLLGRLAARGAGVPVVVHTYHGIVGELSAAAPSARLFLACERLGARLSDRLIAVSADTARHFQQWGVGKRSQYEVVPNGVDLEYFLAASRERPAALRGEPIVGSIGSLTREKGIELLLEGLPFLLSRHPRLQLCIVGDGPLRRPLQEQARALGVGDRVLFCGNVEDVRPWLAAFDVFALPSRREGMGIVLLEAMAMGRPIVASCTGGIPEAVRQGETAVLVPPGDAEALAAALDELLRDGARGAAMGRAGREWVARQFDLRRMLRRLESLYAKLLAASEKGR